MFSDIKPTTSAPCKQCQATSSSTDRYVVCQLTNVPPDGWEKAVVKITQAFGPEKSGSRNHIGFGLSPYLLGSSILELQKVVTNGFEWAVRYDVPVYFQIDDQNFAPAWFRDRPEMCEWVSFPTTEEPQPKLPRFWFNWGAWGAMPAIPCFESREYQRYVQKQLADGVTKPIRDWLKRLKRLGKEYLFAGIAIGWETHVPTYEPGVPVYMMDPKNPPTAINDTDPKQMQTWEMAQTGYHSLHLMGYSEAKLRSEAIQKKLAIPVLRNQLLYGVILRHSARMASVARKSGIPRQRIFTHMVGIDSKVESPSTHLPPIWASVNRDSLPGFTLSNATAEYDLHNLHKKLLAADRKAGPFACAETYFIKQQTTDSWSEFANAMWQHGCVLIDVWGFTDPPTSGYYADPVKGGAAEVIRQWVQSGG